LRFKVPAVLNQYVQTISLPPAYREPTAGRYCSVCGWGNTAIIGGKLHRPLAWGNFEKWCIATKPQSPIVQLRPGCSPFTYKL